MRKESFIADKCADIGVFIFAILSILAFYFGIFRNIIEKIKDDGFG